MTMAKLKVDGLDKLEKALKKNVTLKMVKDTVAINGQELRNKMVKKADFTQGYQTGTTKRSISKTTTNGGFSVEVGPETEYAPYLEYGTRFMDAQPFVSVALDEQAKQFKRDMQNLVK